MLIFKAMAFSSRGHNIFNNQYKMATVIHDREGVGREARGARGWQCLPQPEGAQAGCSGGGRRRVDPRPWSTHHGPRTGGRPHPAGARRALATFPPATLKPGPGSSGRERGVAEASPRGGGAWGQRFHPGRGLRAARLGCARLTPPRTGARSRPSALGPRTATRLLTLEAGNTPKTSFRLRRPLCLPTTRLH